VNLDENNCVHLDEENKPVIVDFMDPMSVLWPPCTKHYWYTHRVEDEEIHQRNTTSETEIELLNNTDESK
jgi:hypothetical protein